MSADGFANWAMAPVTNFAAAFSPDGKANLTHGKISRVIAYLLAFMNFGTFVGGVLLEKHADGTFGLDLNFTQSRIIALVIAVLAATIMTGIEWVMWAFLWTKGWKMYTVVEKKINGLNAQGNWLM